MSATILMLLYAAPDQAERLSDLLAEAGLPQGWHESAADLVGGDAPYVGARERVLGRRARVRFELLLAADEVARVEALLGRLPQLRVVRLPLALATDGRE